MSKVISHNIYLKLGIEAIIESWDINAKGVVFIDVTEGFVISELIKHEKIILISGREQFYLVNLFTSHLNRIVVEKKSCLLTFLNAVRRIDKTVILKRMSLNLSHMELNLLPYFCSGLKIHDISEITGVPSKNLYCTRRRICSKFGLINSRDLISFSKVITDHIF